MTKEGKLGYLARLNRLYKTGLKWQTLCKDLAKAKRGRASGSKCQAHVLQQALAKSTFQGQGSV